MATESKQPPISDLSFLELEDADLLPVFSEDFDEGTVEGEMAAVQKLSFDKRRADQLAKTTKLDADLSALFFRLYGAEYTGRQPEELDDSYYDKYIQDLIRQAGRLRIIKDFIKSNQNNTKMYEIASSYIDYRIGQRSKGWIPRMYLMSALRRSAIFVLVSTAVFLAGMMLEADHSGWIGLYAVVIVIGLFVMAGIPKRYQLRKRFAAYLAERGADD